MKILYIIGNGLDIACKLKTSYQDFFKYYLSHYNFDQDIQDIKKNIEKHKYDSWADLEIGLGDYSKHCKTKEIFLKCLNDLKVSLKNYLKEESKKIDLFQTGSTLKFLYPDKLLELEPQAHYNSYVDSIDNKTVFIDVITLNYTETLENILGYHNGRISLSDGKFLNSINHIHGTLDDMMVVGVNDNSQISNPLFKNDEDILEEFIKPEFNDACMNNKNHICENLISQANVIVLYGTSLGLSDDKWWRIIGKRMEKEAYPLLVYLPYDEKKDIIAEPNHLRRWTRKYVTEIKQKFDIQLEDKLLSKRMCIAINKRIFDIEMINNPLDLIR